MLDALSLRVVIAAQPGWRCANIAIEEIQARPARDVPVLRGHGDGRLASYRVNSETGALSSLDIYTVGRRPAAVLAVPLSR